MWYMGPHPKSDGEPVLARDPELSPKQAVPMVSRAKVIERLLDVDSRQACTQTEPEDFPKSQQDGDAEKVSLLAEPEESLPFPMGWLQPDHVVRATDEPRPASPALQALIDLSDVELAQEQEQDPNLRLIMDMIRNSPERPSWEHVRAESAEVKALWSQYGNLKIQDGALLRHHKNQGLSEEWQIVAPQLIRTRIFQACHHHKLAAHQGVVRTSALIKRRFYWPNMQKDVESWCQRCAVCGKCKAAVRGHGQLQQPTYGAFNEKVSVDLRGPFKRTPDGNEYIAVMQDHFTKWVEGRAICGKEALTVADAVVQEWILKHGAPISLHSDRGKEFTAALHQEVCDMLRIAKTYSTAYQPQANGMVERCNRSLLAMLRAVVSEQQVDWDDHLPAVLSAYRSTPIVAPDLARIGWSIEWK